MILCFLVLFLSFMEQSTGYLDTMVYDLGRFGSFSPRSGLYD